MDPVTASLILGGTGVLSGIMGNSAAAHQNKVQMLTRAADQRAAPYLSAAHVPVELTPYTNQRTDGAGNILQGALAGYQTGSNLSKAAEDNKVRELMLQKLMGNDPGLAAAQTSALNSSSLMSSAPAASSGINEAALQSLLSKYSGA